MSRFYYTDYIHFAPLKIFERAHKAILSEVPAFDKSIVDTKRGKGEWVHTISGEEFIRELGGTAKWIESWTDEKTWYNYPLMFNDKAVADAKRKCPKTISLLEDLGNINLAGFSLMTPNSELPIHTDPTGITNNSYAVNMLLSGGPSELHMFSQKGDQITHRHEIGKAVFFNSEMRHYATNLGASDRVILYIDLSLGSSS